MKSPNFANVRGRNSQIITWNNTIKKIEKSALILLNGEKFLLNRP